MDGHSMKVRDNELTDDQLSKLAKRVTKYRKIQRDRALAVQDDFQDVDAEAYQRTTESLARRMHNGYFPRRRRTTI